MIRRPHVLPHSMFCLYAATAEKSGKLRTVMRKREPATTNTAVTPGRPSCRPFERSLNQSAIRVRSHVFR